MRNLTKITVRTSRVKVNQHWRGKVYCPILRDNKIHQKQTALRLLYLEQHIYCKKRFLSPGSHPCPQVYGVQVTQIMEKLNNDNNNNNDNDSDNDNDNNNTRTRQVMEKLNKKIEH